MSDAPACFRVSTLAARWDCSPGKIREMLRAGTIPCLRLGKMVRIPISAVHAFEAQCHDQPDQDCAKSQDETPGTSMTSALVSLRAARIAAKLNRF